MRELPKTTVIIPVRNDEKHILNCLQSVLAQSVPANEIIVVDNDSNDGTKNIIQEIIPKNPSVIYLFEKIHSRGGARNAGEQKATGDIILMTDSDCIVPNDWIEKMCQPIISVNVDAVQGGELSAMNDYWSRQQQIRVEEKFEKIANEWPLGGIDTKNFAIKKMILKEIGYSDKNEISVNDTALSIEMKKHGFKVAYVPSVKVTHFHPSSFFEVLKKQIQRGYHFKKLINKNKKFLNLTNFKTHGNISFSIAFNKINELLKGLKQKGFSYMLYDLVAGGAWRVGVALN